MKNKFALLGCLVMALFVYTPLLQAQTPNTTLPKPFVVETSKEAKELFGALKKKHLAMKGISLDYELMIENGDQKEKQTGTLLRTGTQYRLIMPNHEIISDAQSVWTYSKKQNEVQISDFDPSDEDLLSPNNLLNFDKTEKKFYYEITGEDANAIYIEFKPLEKKSEYAKLRFKIGKKLKDIQEIKAFTKDSTRYTLTIKKLQEVVHSKDKFMFNKNAYPGVRTVDLRD